MGVTFETVQPSITPRRMKSFTKKNKNVDTSGGVTKRSRIADLNDHVRSCLKQVTSMFGYQEPIVAQDSPRVERISGEDEVEGVKIDSSRRIGEGYESVRHEGPRTPSLERVTTPQPPVNETVSILVEDPSGSVPVYPEVNTKNRRPTTRSGWRGISDSG